MPHVLVFPFPTQGHLNPASVLAQRLGEARLRVTIVHTQGNLQALAQHPQPDHTVTEPSSSLAIQLSHDVWARALPLKAEQMKQLSATAPLNEIVEAVETMSSALEQLMLDINSDSRGERISYIISDSFMPWTMDVARRFRIPRAELWTSSATGYLIGVHLSDIIERGYLPIKPGNEANVLDFIPRIPADLEFRLADLALDVLRIVPSHPVAQFLQRSFMRAKEASRVLAHTFYDLEHDAVDALRSEHIRLSAIGPFLQDTEFTAKAMSEDAAQCLPWLNSQAPGTVLYIAFGSAARLDGQDLEQLALGIECSQCAFLWAVRLSSHGGLPEGFERRTSQRGCVTSWAPQLAVLGHPAVGGFLSHCGWNSVMESLWKGVPILGCPCVAEQNTNLWFISKVARVGMPIPGREKHGLQARAVEEGVRSLMQAEEGLRMRKRAEEVGRQARNAMSMGGGSVSSFQEFVEEILQTRTGAG